MGQMSEFNWLAINEEQMFTKKGGNKTWKEGAKNMFEYNLKVYK